MEQKINQLLKEAYSCFGEGEFEKGEELAVEAHKMDFDNSLSEDVLKCAIFWKERKNRLDQVFDDRSKGEYLTREWAGFHSRFLERINSPIDEGLFQIRKYVFGTSIRFFESYMEHSGKTDPALLLEIGRGYKSLGDYEKALEELEKANKLSRDDSEILGEMADVYDMTGDSRIAKLLFREAFFISPQKVRIDFLDSKLLANIVQKLEEKNFSQELLKEWIPVYGVIFGVFNVRRELRPIEVGHLKQSIYALKNEVQESRKESTILLPRLINRYFWLMDHLLTIKEDRSRIEEVLLNIKVLDPYIYDLYTR